MTFENIRLVARYERNLIIRNKLFWIFACCVVVGISLSHWLWQGDSLGGQGHHEQVNKINLQLKSFRFPEQDMENHP